MELIKKKFQPKDMLYNNGVVNLYRFLEDKKLEIEVELNSSSLVLSVDSEKSDEVYFEILQGFFKDYKIVHQTKNDRWYFDENKQDFILDKKFDTVGGQKNDLRNGVYLYKNISEFGLEREYVEGLYLNFCEKYNQKIESESNGSLKVPNKKNEVIVAITLDTAVERFTQYFVGSDTLKRDSKIHSFEDGQGYFQDMVKQPKNYKIDKWDALIYWFGGRVQRFYNREYFIYPNSSNLKALEKFKEFLKIDDERIVFRDDKDKLISTTSNIDFYKKLKDDNIVNKYFYISNSEAEFEVKFFMYLFSIIYHIEEQYEKANKRRRANKKEIYDALQQITFVVYTDDGTFKTSFCEYTKAYELIKFFEVLKEHKLFDYLADILVTFSMSQGGKEVNLNLQKWSQKLLDFSNLRREYYLASFNILKNDSKSFGKKLFEFEKLYLNNIMEGKNMNIHEQSKKLGEQIGSFAGRSFDFLDKKGDRDLLFKLRNIKNSKQLISFFKDVEFSFLKEYSVEYEKNYYLNTKDILEEIDNTNWETIRDYISIYAINQYKYEMYKKNKGDK